MKGSTAERKAAALAMKEVYWHRASALPAPAAAAAPIMSDASMMPT